MDQKYKQLDHELSALSKVFSELDVVTVSRSRSRASTSRLVARRRDEQRRGEPRFSVAIPIPAPDKLRPPRALR